MGEKQKIKTLYMPIHKDISTGKLVGVLSSDAVDREDEIISAKLLNKWKSSQAIPALTDHTNSINTYAGGWKNFRIEKSGDMTALIAEPIFFKTNPNTAHLESMVKEAKELGLPFGISIGAIVKEVSSTQRGSKTFTQWDDAELLEASWVAIPANQTAGVKSLMKSLKTKTNDESDIKNIKMGEDKTKSAEASKTAKEDKNVEGKTSEKKVEKTNSEKTVSEKTFTLEEVKTLIANEVKEVKKEFTDASEKSEKALTEKVSDAIAEALKNMEATKKSAKTDAGSEIDINNLTNG